MIAFPVTIILLIIAYYWWTLSKRRGFKLPPECPYRLPILGSAHMFIAKDTTYLYKLLIELGNYCIDQGGVMYGRAGPYLCYGVTDPDDCVTVLTSCLEKNWIYEFTKPWAGDGLASVTSNLGIHRRHRKIISRAFNQQILDSYISVFNRQSKNLIEILAGKVGKGPFDHSHDLEDIALGTMHQTTMGFNESEMNNVYEKQHVDAIRTMLKILAKRFQHFWMYNEFIYSFTSLKKQQDKTIALLHRLSDEVIQQKKLVLNSAETKSRKVKSFLDLLLELPEKDAFTDKEIKDEVETMIVAGSDTSSTMLTYALMLLGSNQDIQEKVYEELREVFNDSLRDVEKQDLSNLMLLEGVLMETMRLYPIIPTLMRYVAEDTKLKNYTLPAGSSVFAVVHATHRDPAVWGPDAAEFNPQRWVPPNSPPSAALRSYAGFSIGKRGCIGKTYALMSMKSTLAHVLRHYRIHADISKLELQLIMFTKPASGCEITVEPRQRVTRPEISAGL